MGNRSSRSAFELDIVIIISTVALTVIGILFIYSSGIASTGQLISREYIRQIIWLITGFFLLGAITFLDYRSIEKVALWIYIGALLLLVITLLFGRVVNGARSWLGIGNLGVQPSEFSKLATIIMLARYYQGSAERRRSLIGFLGGFGLVLVPMILVLLQPDLGTSLVYIPIFLFIGFIADTKIRYLLFVLLFSAIAATTMALPVWHDVLAESSAPWISVITDTEKIKLLLAGLVTAMILSFIGFRVTHKRAFYWFSYIVVILVTALPMGMVAARVLQEYQIMRLIVFIDPYIDPRGAGWNIIQSITAVGSGGSMGKGFLQGTQSHYQYLPQQSTDFIFSILAEEWGFIGSAVVFSLFALLLIRGLIIMHNARDHFAAYSAAGIVGMIFFHVVVNIGMAIGVMPITGIPLMFLSYGGSSLWTALLSVGILLSIYQHRYQY